MPQAATDSVSAAQLCSCHSILYRHFNLSWPLTFVHACVQPAAMFSMAPGDVFVQRNVGNLVSVKDLNCMSCLEYTIDHLKVKHILVTGHYNCGAPRFSSSNPLLNPDIACRSKWFRKPRMRIRCRPQFLFYLAMKHISQVHFLESCRITCLQAPISCFFGAALGESYSDRGHLYVLPLLEKGTQSIDTTKSTMHSYTAVHLYLNAH